MSGPGSYWGRSGATAHQAHEQIRSYEDGHDAGYELGKRDAKASAGWAFGAGVVLTLTAVLWFVP